MRNLQLLRNLAICESLLSNFCKYYIVNEPSTCKSTLIFGFTECLEVYMLTVEDNKYLKNTFVTDLSQHISNTENVSVIECNYLFNELYIILSTGHLVIISVFNSENKDVFVRELSIGSLNYVSWSPDLERTVIINSEELLFVLSIVNDDFEKLTEVSLQDSSEEQNKFINVGWGSVETQFRGTEGKFSKSATTETPEDNLNDDKVQICWKHNSSAFAVSYICRSDRIRKVKIFNQDGVLQNITKDIHGLQSVLDWCPSRNLITCVQTLPNKQVVCFLEENALRHGEFQLWENIQIIRLYWNNAGNILACIGTTEADGEFIALLTTSNYKWYLKQKLQFKERVLYVQWDHSSPNRLHLMLESGVYRMYEWLFQISDSSKCSVDGNMALVAVINNRNINFIPYRQVCMPPSMPAETVEAPNSVNAVVFPSSFPNTLSAGKATCFNSNSTISYLSDNRLLVLQYEGRVQHTYIFTFGDIDQEIEFSTPLEISSWLWMLPNFLFFCWSRQDGNYFCVATLDAVLRSVVITQTFKMNSLIMDIAPRGPDVAVLCEDGKLFHWHTDELRSMKVGFVEPCYRLELQMRHEVGLMALSENKNFYINQNIKYRDIISFYWRNPFLIFITMSSHLLIAKINHDAKIPPIEEIYKRSIEPKSYIVTFVDDQVILETERGNLEIITPRPFSILKMEETLNEGKYFEAFKLLRKQRINLNIIYDHDPIGFIKAIRRIIDDIGESSYLLNFIMELENENVAKRMFPWKYDKMKDEADKVKKVCKEISDSIEQSDNMTHICPLIAALVRQDKLTEAANYAIKHNEISTLCHLSDAKAVYESALGSYDLECALKIIQHSKLDPSEYLPFIHELQETEENYRKFKICDYLEKYSEAFKHLSLCGSEKFEESLKYMERHTLYRDALQVYNAKLSSETNEQYLKIAEITANYFFKNKQYEEAAILYEKAKKYHKSLTCYLSIPDWFSCIANLKCLRGDKDQERKALLEVYEILHKQGHYENAGLVACNFLGNSEKAVQSYLAGKKFCYAINAAKVLNNEDLIKSVIQPHLEEETTTIIESLISDSDSIIKFTQRLSDIKSNKKHQDKMNDDDRASVISASTDSSDGSSVSSFNSRTSSASSSAKRARRQERKLWNLKPGNPREEPSIINAIRESITYGEKHHSVLVSDMIRALLRIDNFQLASRLRTEYDGYLARVDKAEKKTWPIEDVKEEGGFKEIRNKCPPDRTLHPKWELKI